MIFRKLLILFLLIISIQIISYGEASITTIHVFVALCDNENQGIVPVPTQLGKGDQPASNLYWGAAYGMKSYFINNTDEWKLVKTEKPGGNFILERIVFKHSSRPVYLIADAYRGDAIKQCISAFLLASNWQNQDEVALEEISLGIGGNAHLLAYIGHDGLMEFELNPSFRLNNNTAKPVIILACYSKEFFAEHLKNARANPILWTTHLMAPEAYTLKAAIEGWLAGESHNAIEERAAQTYHKYQKCGIKGARNLFTTGF